MAPLVAAVTLLLALSGGGRATQPPALDGPPKTEAELLAILSRAATVSGFLIPGASDVGPNASDTIRMLQHTGARYAGRSVFVWGGEGAIPKMLPHVKSAAAAVHAAVPELVLEGAVFEIVTKPGVESLAIPPYVFRAFGLPVSGRNFNYSAMLFPDGKLVDHWPGNGPDASVPDLAQLEAQLWFFYVGTSWIRQGIEALHCGQIMLMSSEDKGMAKTHALFSRLRDYASQHARRGFVLLNAHLYQDPFVHLGSTDTLIFDFHAFPSRPMPHADRPQNCTLNASFEDAMYFKSAGGTAVAGWRTTSLPYIVELDNYGCTSHPGAQWANDTFHPFGWDEISWFAHQPSSYRSFWLRYAASWLARNDPKGHFEMPFMRNVCDHKFAGRLDSSFYDASRSSFGQEDAIAQIWEQQPDLKQLQIKMDDMSFGMAPPPLFRQCDHRWGQTLMGTKGDGEQATICKEGCAMSCVAMALAAHGFDVPCPPPQLGCQPTPGTLNDWLQAHDGYHCAAGDCNNLVLTAPDQLTGGRMRLIGEWNISAVASSAKINNSTALAAGVDSGEVVFLAHVHNPSVPGFGPVDHFVLLDSVDLATNSFGVRDPYYNETSYPLHAIADVLQYEVLPAESIVPLPYPLYKQCDPRWAQDRMGKGGTHTICAVGCLMSSTSMALNQRGILIDGQPSTPGTLNAWLRNNGGYVPGSDDFEESAAERISPRIRWTNSSMHRTNDMPWSAVVSLVDEHAAVIINVMHGEHFVLVVGYDKEIDGDILYVNDPGFNRQSYSYSKDVVGYRLFDLSPVLK